MPPREWPAVHGLRTLASALPRRDDAAGGEEGWQVRRPSFQFYPGDWSANPNLKRCTFAEKGIWLEAMCLMHDQPDYGVLRWPLKEIAEAVKCRPADLQALIRKGVLKGADHELTEPFIYTPRTGRKDGYPVVLLAAQPGPIWYSSRMVRDEYVRTTRGEASRFGEGNSASPIAAPNYSPKPPFGDGPSSSSSSSEKKKTCSKPLGLNVAEFPPGFDRFWAAYPRKQGKKPASKVFARIRPDDFLLQTLLDAIAAWVTTEQWSKEGGKFVPLPETWLSKELWNDELPASASFELDAVFSRGAA